MVRLVVAFLAITCAYVAAATNVVVSFDGTAKILAHIESQRFAVRSEKIGFLRQSLLDHATQTQRRAVTLISQAGADFASFWINNRIIVKNADDQLISVLSALPEVSEVREEYVMELVIPVEVIPAVAKQAGNEWGLIDIQAPEAWEAGYDGTGVVVAAIDSGARYTHEALIGNFRQDHGWFDPYSSNTTEPTDRIGHGTHVTATIAGTHGVGVAPGAKWIACRGCGTITCTEDALTKCGEFVMAPTNPDGSDPKPELAPHLVSNSWGGGKNNTFYNSIVDAWNVAGIIPVFAIGNSGPGCGSANSPGDQAIGLIAVGSTNDEKTVSVFSSKGPTLNGDLKPDVCAPGSAIVSAFATSDTAYIQMSGTSMAAPHASGVIALMLSAKPGLTFHQVFDILKTHNDRDLNIDVRMCGEANPPDYPNHSYGHGKVNALKAVLAAVGR